MAAKKLLLLIVVVFGLSFLLQAERMMPLIPLEKLQDPKSPLYVPVPYPKTREEIITDLEYYIKKYCHPRKKKWRFTLKNIIKKILFPWQEEIFYSSPADEFFFKLLDEDSGVFVGRIVRVSNRTYHWAKEFILIDIHDDIGSVGGRITLEDSGRYTGWRFMVGNFCRCAEPLLSLPEVKEIFANHSQPLLSNAEIKSIEYERHLRCSSYHIKVNAVGGIFYMDCDGAIYRVIKRERLPVSSKDYDFTKPDEVDKYRFGLMLALEPPLPKDRSWPVIDMSKRKLIDTISDEIIHLEKVE